MAGHTGADGELLILDPLRERLIAMSSDGSVVREIVTGLAEYPDGLAVDTDGGWIYWTNMGTDWTARTGSIERVRLDGSGRSYVHPPGSFVTGKQLVLDARSQTLFWCDREGMAIMRSPASGGDVEVLVRSGRYPQDSADARRHCVGIAVDTTAGVMYWTQKGAPKGGGGRIFRAGIDIPQGQAADTRTDIEILWEELPEPIDLELDHRGGLYWTDRGAAPAGNTLNHADIPHPGRSGRSPSILISGMKEAIGLAIDTQGSAVFVADLSGRVYSVQPGVADSVRLVAARPGSSFTGIRYLPGHFIQKGVA
ncbi:hypothetical protein [Mycobacteroides abscessus]|uniref:hypothetical protein n=1 Tax=Mycobacteroides abscessus TaxID=36809 RepID=UPI00025879EB|nr:hypothetical protein [Mycobacteroides abscessus]EIC67509.1 hypothetical protein OUW_07243 [Mycobacteroides abscessus M93]MBN7532757.1 3-hydroxyacyl-CoA dehydrogenase [Mycobacteroides abscessus subsp. abscessus]